MHTSIKEFHKGLLIVHNLFLKIYPPRLSVWSIQVLMSEGLYDNPIRCCVTTEMRQEEILVLLLSTVWRVLDRFTFVSFSLIIYKDDRTNGDLSSRGTTRSIVLREVLQAASSTKRDIIFSRAFSLLFGGMEFFVENCKPCYDFNQFACVPAMKL